MKKTFLLIFAIVAIIGIINIDRSLASTNYVVPKAPDVTPSLKPCIEKYKQGNYTGAMVDIETLLKNEKNNTLAKYYLALCYTKLGYKEEAKVLYNEVLNKNDNSTLSYYSQKAVDCLDDPNSEKCSPLKPQTEKEKEEVDDITEFIQSGRKIHPAAMDRITRERMERKLQESEYIRKQQEENQPLKSDASIPTNEEIASALNTLAKIGINPFSQNQTAYNLNPLNLQSNQINPMMLLNNNNLYQAMLQNGQQNPEITKMFLLNSLTGQQNNLINYGI